MKNKKVTTGLIVVVIAVWGIIFLRIISSFTSKDDFKVRKQNQLNIVEQSFQEVKPYSLLANYRDPFLGKNYSVEGKPKVKKEISVAPKVKVEPIPEIDWSFIKYLGLINNNNVEKRVALISIHKQEFMIKEGDIIKEVECIKYYMDSIKISYQGKIKCIKR